MIEKLFNPKKTIFLGLDESGRIQARGRFYAELDDTEYSTIKSCVISGFKQKNLEELVNLFPNLIQVNIEKTSKLLSLEGIERLVGLRKINLQDCPNLKDLSSLKMCSNLAEVKLSMFKNADYIMKNGILIGCHQGLTINNIKTIHNLIFKFIRRFNG